MNSPNQFCRCIVGCNNFRHLAIAARLSTQHLRYASTTRPNTSKVIELVSKEHQRQKLGIRRLNKIKISCVGVNNQTIQLAMNKDLSTPYACSLHVGEEFSKNASVAFVNQVPWDMHKPLVEDCEVRFQTYDQTDPTEANKAFWKTCSVILGSVINSSFDAKVMAYKPINTKVESGSFAYDFIADFKEWNPTSTELQSLSRVGSRLSFRDHPMCPLTVSVEKAREIFAGNIMKMLHIEEIAQLQDSVTLYTVKNNVDIIDGPLISNLNQIGRFNITAVHNLGETTHGYLYRMQGVALPKLITMHSWTYKLLTENAKAVNLSDKRTASNRQTQSQTKQKPEADTNEYMDLQQSGQVS